jgi:outer membrane cobalamin receptor
MKTRNFMVIGALLCVNALVLTVCRAGEEASQPAPTAKTTVVAPTAAVQPVPSQKTAASAATQTNATVMTGSYIPTKVNRNGRITDGELNVTVIDRAAIDQSGATSVAQVLAREPGVTIRHR